MTARRLFVLMVLCGWFAVPLIAQSITILSDEFEGVGFDSAVWDTPRVGTGGVSVNNGKLTLEARDGGTQFLRPTKPSFASPYRFAPTASLPLVLTMRVGPNTPHASSWGLGVGSDRANAIEFTIRDGVGLIARTASNGTATETVFFNFNDPPPLYFPPMFYSIIAYPGLAVFSVNGQPVAVNTTNVPTVAMNPLFSVTSDTTAHPSMTMIIDSVVFSRH